MRITITGKNLEISDYLRDMAEKQVEKLDRYFDDDTNIQIVMAVEKSRHIVEVTAICRREVIRAEEVSGDMYASLNGALKKLEKRLIKHRTKIEKSLRSGAFRDSTPVFGETVEADEMEQKGVVKVKHFDLKPMTVDEAIMQLELVGHSFYVFTNAESNAVNVVYLRHDGAYGLIIPD